MTVTQKNILNTSLLLADFSQFSKNILRHYPKIHRGIGYVYVINILMITGPAGLLMSFYANGGISSKIAFLLLSVLWIGFTAMALQGRAERFYKSPGLHDPELCTYTFRYKSSYVESSAGALYRSATNGPLQHCLGSAGP